MKVWAEPTDRDIAYNDWDARAEFEKKHHEDRKGSDWCCSPIDEVRHNVGSTGYPRERIRFVKGLVQDTIPDQAPEHIALVRLDTDWYESTLHELRHLYPRLAVGGVLLVDDYFYWRGSRDAVDEYIDREGLRIFLNPIDGGGAIGVKQG